MIIKTLMIELLVLFMPFNSSSSGYTFFEVY